MDTSEASRRMFRATADAPTVDRKVRSDESLMQAVADGDLAAFESLYDSHHRLVFGVALRVLGDALSAEDLTQTVYRALWANPHAFIGGSFTAWIARVTRNGGMDVLRRRSTSIGSRMAADVPLDHAMKDLVVETDAKRARGALARLPDDERLPIEMGYFGGMTYDRIAAETGIPLGTVKTRIRSGLRRLREALTTVPY